jgi:hypothetical protein
VLTAFPQVPIGGEWVTGASSAAFELEADVDSWMGNWVSPKATPPTKIEAAPMPTQTCCRDPLNLLCRGWITVVGKDCFVT